MVLPYFQEHDSSSEFPSFWNHHCLQNSSLPCYRASWGSRLLLDIDHMILYLQVMEPSFQETFTPWK
ncbi:rCG46965 [Rattus norvegicus]|uniref:RCG46965 n=1 Tax=Rattus norvegicus TaxID=10116 RepID=A6IXA3_RAT|nr:rCG46965 [Rattus norvegicus]